MTETPETLTSEIVKVGAPELPPVARDVVVLARTPEEMATSQAGLLDWARQKVEAERAELREKEENLSYAKKGKYQTNAWKRQVSLAKHRVIYYEKVLAALEAGYYIVPDMPGIDTIAIRTRRVAPPQKVTESQWGRPRVPDVKSQTLPLGEGDYVNPTPVVDRWDEVRKDRQGRDETYHLAASRAFAGIDFPFHLVKPQILRDFNHALELRIFDQIGVLPQRRKRGGDPMVIGTVLRRVGYEEHAVNFLLSWWIDTRDL